MSVIEDLARARAAFERRDWVAAYGALSEADERGMVAADFARLAATAYLLGRQNDCVQALQRAYKGHIEAGEKLPAIRAAYWLAMVLLEGGEAAVGGGWMARAERLLAEVDEDVVERGYVRMLQMFRHIFSGEYEQGYVLAEQIVDDGRRFQDPDLEANGLNAQGRMLIYSGRVPEGLALLDEAMVVVTTAEVSPIFAGQVYCSLIEACQEISDFGRAAEWTSVLTRWIETQPDLVTFTGQCAVHRGQIMRVRGAFKAAVEEFESAVARYLAVGTPAAAGLAMDECGNALRILGDLPAAEDAFERAIAFGHDPQPNLALLWLARGRTSDAAAAIHRVLSEPRDPVHRSQLLPASVEVLLAGGEADEAAALSEELSAVAEGFGCPALRAMALYAEGSILIARGKPAEALTPLRAAQQLWRRLESPYEGARTRILIGLALRVLGDEHSATTELKAARHTFHELGASTAEKEAARLLAPGAPRGLTEREVEVLRQVASGKSNPDIAETLVLSEKTVARHLSNIFVKLDVTSRTAAAAFAYEHDLL
ncbi:MAG TPA: LuxR C-terminal-related transcriptional regulator [Nocardioidaceae bacterium]|nr:LuxR C-terminal-related transcriptional regulator [Nocardioidaceae bacterium]